MVATPGSGGTGSGARAMTYRDKMVKAHDKFWPEVDKVEPILTDLWNELSESHLTVPLYDRSIPVWVHWRSADDIVPSTEAAQKR